MSNNSLVAVTGVSGYTGKYITRRLLAQGQAVINLTGHPERPNEFGAQVKSIPFNFEDPKLLTENLRGVSILYNTYWVRFDHGKTTFASAVENTRTLIESAQVAGIKRVVHVSITNPNIDPALPYFRGKAELEQAILSISPSYAIIRPTVIFGLEDILINNIAFLLRRFPLFAIPGDGNYRLQPIYAEDMAVLCTQAGQADENLVWDAVGPDIFTFNELVGLIAAKVNSRAKIVHLPPHLALNLARLVGLFARDVVLTEDELNGLSAGLLVSQSPPKGKTRLTDWLETHADRIGTRYASELARHFR